MTPTLTDRLIDLITRSIDVGLGREAFTFASIALQMPSAPEIRYQVRLDSTEDGKKIPVIKTIRELTGLGLKDAKDMSEAPGSVVLETLNQEEALKAKMMLQEVGAQVSITQMPTAW